MRVIQKKGRPNQHAITGFGIAASRSVTVKLLLLMLTAKVSRIGVRNRKGERCRLITIR